MWGCGSINLVLFDVLNIHFTADFCDSSPENCGLFEESIDICLMEQTVRKPSVAVHLSEHLRTPSNVASIPSRQVGLKKDNSTPMIKDAIGGFFSALDQEFHVWDKGLIVQSIVQSIDPFLCQVSLANKKQPSCISRTSRKRGSCKWTEIRVEELPFESNVQKKAPCLSPKLSMIKKKYVERKAW